VLVHLRFIGVRLSFCRRRRLADWWVWRKLRCWTPPSKKKKRCIYDGQPLIIAPFLPRYPVAARRGRILSLNFYFGFCWIVVLSHIVCQFLFPNSDSYLWIIYHCHLGADYFHLVDFRFHQPTFIFIGSTSTYYCYAQPIYFSRTAGAYIMNLLSTPPAITLP